MGIYRVVGPACVPRLYLLAFASPPLSPRSAPEPSPWSPAGGGNGGRNIGLPPPLPSAPPLAPQGISEGLWRLSLTSDLHGAFTAPHTRLLALGGRPWSRRSPLTRTCTSFHETYMDLHESRQPTDPGSRQSCGPRSGSCQIPLRRFGQCHADVMAARHNPARAA